MALQENRLDSLAGKINLLTWMVGFNVAMTAGLPIQALH